MPSVLPKVESTWRVADKHNVRSVGRIAGLAVEAELRGDRFCRAAFHGKSIEMANQIECQGLPIRFEPGKQDGQSRKVRLHPKQFGTVGRFTSKIEGR